MSDRVPITDPETGEIRLLSYDELDSDIVGDLLHPDGTFTYSAQSFLRLPIGETPFYIKDWLPKSGKMVIYGMAKTGKSYLCLQMANCLGEGEPFLTQETKAAKVLYLQFELGVGVLQSRMRETGFSYNNVFVGTTFSLKLDDHDSQEMLRHELDIIKPNVLILDPLYKCISGDENEAHDMEIITDYLDSLIALHEDTQMAIVLLHHAGKDVSRGARGSSVLEGWVDSYIEMKKVMREDKGLGARLTPKSLRHAPPPDEPINMVLNENYEFVVGDMPTTVKEKLALYVKQKGKATLEEIHAANLGSRKGIYDARLALEKEGKIKYEKPVCIWKLA